MFRISRLLDKLPDVNIDAILVGSPINRRYLSGFTGSAGWILLSKERALLAVDFRYVEQAAWEAVGFEIYRINDDLSSWLPPLMLTLNIGRLGIEADYMPVSIYQSLCKRVQESCSHVEIVPLKNMVEHFRAIKNADEVINIEKACLIADSAMQYVMRTLEVGMTEKQLAWMLESFVRENGSEALPFEIIVASGPNSALPHAHPTDRQIAIGEPVIIDLGAKVGGYCSDMTRTFIVGEITEKYNTIYNVVISAQINTAGSVVEGISAREADALARRMIEAAGYGDLFGHGLGHGIGLETHEAPRVSFLSDDILVNNMVFTIEPGIYLPGWGGIRIEDSVMLTGGTLRFLTHASKETNIRGG
jgi:Xaa-Pro aminopeptidase